MCEIEKKPWECENGRVYKLPANHCVFCTHCKDILYDYTNGPYGFFCDLDKEYSLGDDCGSFKSDGYEFDEEDYLKRIKEHKEYQEKIENNAYFKEIHKRIMDRITDRILYGEEKRKKVGMIGMNSPLAELARHAKESITIPRMTIYWLTRDERDLVEKYWPEFLEHNQVEIYPDVIDLGNIEMHERIAREAERRIAKKEFERRKNL